MIVVRIAVVAAVLLQLYFIVTCGMWWGINAENGHLFDRRHPDELLLDVLAVAKVFVGPISFVTLAVKPDWGKSFTGIAFLSYAAGSFAMPFLARFGSPMAWWPNASAAGEGPIMAIFFLALGLVLTFHKNVARSLADAASPPAPDGTK